MALFSILKLEPFWEQLWFIFLVISFVIILIWFIVKRYINRIKKEHKVQQTISDLERRALQAQMNPHFIFNSLTSIQSLISENNNEKAEDFLITFSRLVRIALNHSSKAFVLLEEEVELIENYIKLESLRFSSVFNYSIKIDPILQELEVEIPPMVIQPFIENAIEHGLLKMRKKGNLEIQIKIEDEDFIQCVVTDDGIGRLKSLKTPKRKGRESKGIKLAKDRLHILNTKSSIKIIDLMHDEHPSGTKVILKIPYKK